MEKGKNVCTYLFANHMTLSLQVHINFSLCLALSLCPISPHLRNCCKTLSATVLTSIPHDLCQPVAGKKYGLPYLPPAGD